ncbi:MAG: MAPEG family protein [Phormidesmis sp. RL_2_1]|nr:MAPEG family protein [Phormidesmis sp. RL_2_1]
MVYSLPVLSAFVSPANVLLWSVAIAAILIYLPYCAVGFGRMQVGYDMGAPRAMFDKLPDYAQRATWAHQNSFESFSLYAPAALMGFVVGLAPEQVVTTAAIYLASRMTYSLFYIVNVPVLRSLSWAISMGSIFTLYFHSCQAAFS